jgi:hypothetical protein
MRKSYLLIATAGVAFLSACGGGSNNAVSADLLKDLELASSDDGITLGNEAVASSQVVLSSIESNSPPARQVAKSAPVKRYKPARKSPPQVAKTEAPADVIESEPVTVASMPVVTLPDAPITPRPQPIQVSYPSGPSSVGSDGSVGNGSATGAVLGTIFGVVLRGGAVGDDHCVPNRGRRTGGGMISINRQIPNRPGLGRVAIGNRPRGDITSRFPH